MFADADWNMKPRFASAVIGVEKVSTKKKLWCLLHLDQIDLRSWMPLLVSPDPLSVASHGRYRTNLPAGANVQGYVLATTVVVE